MKEEKESKSEDSDTKKLESKEGKGGSEKESTSSPNIISEEFQNKAHSLIHKEATSKGHLSLVRNHLNDREEAMRKEEMAAAKKGKKTPDEYSTAEMPSSY